MLMLIAFGGLPGSGKTTIARHLAAHLKAVYLRVDSIEQAIRSSGLSAAGADIGPAGYLALYRLAADNLGFGRWVVADSVNPIAQTRNAYRRIAEQVGTHLLEVEVLCSDATEHRHRVETRRSTVDGLTLPTWEDVMARQYDAWDRPHLRLDTATLSVEQSVSRILASIAELQPEKP